MNGTHGETEGLPVIFRGLVGLLMLVLLSACADPKPDTEQATHAKSASILDVTCGADQSTQIERAEVDASPEGVHIRVENETGETVTLAGTGLDFEEGTSEQVARIKPTQHNIACWPQSKHREAEPKRIEVEVKDPLSYWAPVDLDCPENSLVVNVVLEHEPNPQSREGDPQELARDDVDGILVDDKVTPIGYPDAEYRMVGIEREGSTIASLSYSPTDGGWLLGGYSACDSAGLGL